MSDANGVTGEPRVRTLNSVSDTERVAAAQLKMLSAISESGLADQLIRAKTAVLNKVLSTLAPFSTPSDDTLTPQERRSKGVNQLKLMLNSVGPAAASAIIEETVAAYRSDNRLKTDYTGTSFVQTFNSIVTRNDDFTDAFGSSLREMLLPRYAYLDFDNLVDPRHAIDRECGYPRAISPSMYKYMYDRDDMGSRVVDIFADECWAFSPSVYENPEEDKSETPFEQDWQALKTYYSIESVLYRMDKLCGIGHFGVLLIGIDDGKDLSEPVSGIDDWGRSNPNSGTLRNNRLLYLRPFDEYLSYITRYEMNESSPRFGLPTEYNLIFVDMTINAAGASVGNRTNKRVHWTRLVHVIDNMGTSPVFGIPRMQSVFNRLLDLRKIKGACAEAMWKGGFPGVSFEVDPQFVADDPLFDRDAFKETIRSFMDGQQRYLDLIGIKANSLQSNIATNPERYSDMQVQAIAMNKGIPVRILLGSEEAKLASSNDMLNWNKRLGRKLKHFTEPNLIRATVDRLIAMRVMRPPANNKYFVDWEDLNTPTDEDSANLALKYSQAISQYVASGMIHLIKPLDYFTVILKLRPAVAKRLDEQAQKEGGYTKLLKVDPSKQDNPGANGTKSSPASASSS